MDDLPKETRQLQHFDSIKQTFAILRKLSLTLKLKNRNSKLFQRIISMITTAILLLSLVQATTSASAIQNTYYVAPNGSDANIGSINLPFLTLNKASAAAQPGDTIYMRGGIYNKAQIIISNGTADAPITFKEYPGEEAIIDGTGLNLTRWTALILIKNSNYLTINGFEIRNTTGEGLRLDEVNNSTIKNCTVHKITGLGLGGSGDNIIIENNEIYNTALENENEKFGGKGGWTAAIATAKHRDNTPSKNVKIRNNNIHENWGEGIIAWFLNGGDIKGNNLYDNYSVNIYNDTSKNIQITENYIYTTTDNFNRTYGSIKRPAEGILLASEISVGNELDIGAEEITIANNLIIGTGSGIHFWHDSENIKATNSYKNVRIYNNIIKNTAFNPIWFELVDLSYNQPTGNIMRNNIIFKSSSNTLLSIRNNTAWTFSYNDWPDGIPALANEPNSLSVDPKFVDVKFNNFHLKPDSPLINAGTSEGAPTTDKDGNLRVGAFDIGAFEYTETDVTSPSKPIVWSTTHPLSTNYYKNNDPIFNYQASDASPVAGYSYILDKEPLTTPDIISEGPLTSKNYKNISSGTWYFHVKAVDNIGNWSQASHFRINIDRSKPRTYAPKSAIVKQGSRVKLYYKVADSYSSYAKYLKIILKKGRAIKKILVYKNKRMNRTLYVTYKANLAKGKYKIYIYATDQAGNNQIISNINSLIVK